MNIRLFFFFLCLTFMSYSFSQTDIRYQEKPLGKQNVGGYLIASKLSETFLKEELKSQMKKFKATTRDSIGYVVAKGFFPEVSELYTHLTFQVIFQSDSTSELWLYASNVNHTIASADTFSYLSLIHI